MRIATLDTLMMVRHSALASSIFTAGAISPSVVEVACTSCGVTGPDILFQYLEQSFVIRESESIEFQSHGDAVVPFDHNDADDTSVDNLSEDAMQAMVHNCVLVRISREDLKQKL